MAFYIRYYEDEILLQKAEEIPSFLKGLNKLTPDELGLVDRQISKLRSGTNRLFLDAAKKRYLLVIGTAQTSLEEFHKKSKAQQQSSEQRPSAKPASAPVSEPKDEMLADWVCCNLCFILMKKNMPESFIFRAKVRKATVQQAYGTMRKYLEEKYGKDCLVPELSEQVFWYETINKGEA